MVKKVLLACLLTAATARAATYYLSTAGNDQNAGTSPSAPLATIAAASGKAMAGDTVCLASGRYSQSIVPLRSGTATAVIRYQSCDPANPAVLVAPSSGTGQVAILIRDVSNILVTGIHVDGGGTPNHLDHAFASFAVVGGSASHVEISSADLRNANGYNAVSVQDNASYVTLRDLTVDMVGFFHDPYDPAAAKMGGGGVLVGNAIAVTGNVSPAFPHHVLIEHNRLSHAGHDLIAIEGQHNVVQFNQLDNDWSNIPPTVGAAGYRNASVTGTDNVFQGNFLSHAGPGISGWTHNTLMKAEGAHNIVRQNVLAFNTYCGVMSDAFYGNANAQIGPAGYNRIYNNTEYELGSMAWEIRFLEPTGYTGAPPYVRSGDLFMNNLAEETRMSPALDFNIDADHDVWFMLPAPYAPTDGTIVRSNLFHPHGGKVAAVSVPGAADITLMAAEVALPSTFVDNLQAPSNFAVAAPSAYGDFALAAGSAGIDRGAFLTTAAASGTSTRLPVVDASFFSDGLGLVEGDLIQLEGASAQARVVAVDGAAQTLTLASALTFTKGQGVALAYVGKAPDVGAIEYGTMDGAPPLPQKAATDGGEPAQMDAGAVAPILLGGCSLAPGSRGAPLPLLFVLLAVLGRRSWRSRRL
jgi:hypothetical protein